ncbi:MAG: FAD-dependent oxidoreductase [Anaerolineae bacterium]|nr:FAD-dependent oxidoreductase [Anaerolineae bacterium]
MSDRTIVIGAGLSGLAAARELLRRDIPCALIELRARAGGSLCSERSAGFVLDSGPMAFERERSGSLPDGPWPEEAFFELEDQEGGRRLHALREGSEALLQPLMDPLPTGALLTRMAVSSLGRFGPGFAICLENGMVLTAPALVLAAPARAAGRMLYSLCPQVGASLRDFDHDSITRVTLGYRREDIPLPVPAPPDTGFAFCHWTDHPARVPRDHVLLQLGLRMLPADVPAALVIDELQANMGWPPTHIVARVARWPGPDCLEPHEPQHPGRMRALRQQLPAGLTLIGSDYGAPQLEDRVRQARDAATAIADWLVRQSGKRDR